ncbi:MAG: hypothetical protein MUF01_13855 [Bryobacterales bacterium]|jgi:hypothetical protein|nr:hypothetical protein [Bryobacterales bacterium]
MRSALSFVYLVHLGATLALVGLCWFVQVVHYPLFAQVGEQHFAHYEQLHAQRTSWVVAPLMLAELGSGLLLLALAPSAPPVPAVPDGGFALWLWIAMGLLAAIWISTFFVQVPLHGLLSTGFDADVIARLVRTNWIRTLLWTLRGLVLLCLLHPLFHAPVPPSPAS